jgi:hypothetical protein
MTAIERIYPTRRRATCCLTGLAHYTHINIHFFFTTQTGQCVALSVYDLSAEAARRMDKV